MSISYGQLAHSPADIFRNLMIQAGLGSTQNPSNPQPWPISADTELDAPDDMITVTSTQGELYGRIQVTGEHLEGFGIQVKVRSSLSAVGWVKANAVAVSMDQLGISTQLNYQTVTIEANAQQGTPQATYSIGSVVKKGAIIPLGREAAASSRRFLFTINAIFVVLQIS